ncbi:hypothetical protein [uncultured Thomasclavelia sp.]|uniref:hypothetical protein n=1 Tax=uncultured Thomasclavelia sp. TaxID=3025759 RepID=UPI00259A8E63|nr:hypothetical protein [uncultured Thomasclavelia sp.]
MDLWIRSQDRYILTKNTNLYLSDEGIAYRILNDNYDYLGEYKTKERALEVLDEIDQCMSEAVNNGLNMAHYVMPKE